METKGETNTVNAKTVHQPSSKCISEENKITGN
uniref:Uncharacterized protein n=1 Tax=Rhizophora mucronata TaxID=61149 RepID=A0A2P2NE11_RHIMU